MARDEDGVYYRREIEEVRGFGETFTDLGHKIRRVESAFSRRRDERRARLLISCPEILECDRAAAEARLNHPDPAVRMSVLDMIIERWGIDDRVLQVCQRVASQDPDDSVRAAAIYKLGRGSSRNDRGFIRFVKAILTDESQPVATRKASYYALLLISGFDVLKLVPPSKFKFPEGVDWSIVDAVPTD